MRLETQGADLPSRLMSAIQQSVCWLEDYRLVFGHNRIKNFPEAIYALPDHEVAAFLLPWATQRHLEIDEAVARIRDNRGLVPIAIDPKGPGRIIWADLGRYPFREWQFVYTIRHLVKAGGIQEGFTSGVEILDLPELFDDSLIPSALIFHVSRCGSTLVAKALSRPQGHMMISQGGPLQYGFWSLITQDWQRPVVASPEVLRRLRTLVLALCRRRVGDETRAFVKFISWNVLYLDLIAAALPEAACLFLYRDPVEVVASVKRGTTAALEARGTRRASFLSGMTGDTLATASDGAYLSACYARYLETALATSAEIAYVNYRDLDARSFPRVVSGGLGLSVSERDQAVMQEQFRYHAKDDHSGRRFFSDSMEKRASVSMQERMLVEKHCANPLDRLDRSERNLFARGGGACARHAMETIARSCP